MPMPTPLHQNPNQTTSMFSVRSHLRRFRPIEQSLRRYSANAAAALATTEVIYPDPPSQNHGDLPSFLDYAARVGMDTQSTTFVGTHYEYTVQNALKNLGMSLMRTGGRSDAGIDLLGTWRLPTTPHPLKVLIQCKAFANSVKPAQARELEGAFVGAPQGWRGEKGIIALLVSQRSATKGVREAMGRSRWPMGYVLCGPDGKILQMLWNRRTEQEGLLGIGVEFKYGGGDRNDKEVVLTWKGEVIGK